jgi:tetratricopeptide (TPR) repeat protein
MFQELGPDARGLLGVVAFFPQGVNEDNPDWLFSTITNRKNIFDKFCVLSLTYQRDGFITMLAPLRDYLCPKDPTSSPLLCATKECYFVRLSADADPGSPGYEEARWITSEDVNVEHLLDVFTAVDVGLGNIWSACAKFMEHLYWHKPRLVVLGPKLEGLLDNQPFKPKCLFQLSRLFDSVGNISECKRLLVHTLQLWREQRDGFQVAMILESLANASLRLHLLKEGIHQAKEGLEINERLNHAVGQAACLQRLAFMLCEDKQLAAAEEAAFRSINLLPDTERVLVCQGLRALSSIYHSKGETEKAINHFEKALGIADSFNLRAEQFWAHYSLAAVLRDQCRFSKAHAHIEHAKSHAVNDAYRLGNTMELQARNWYKQGKLNEAESVVLCPVGVFEKLGAAMGVEKCRIFLRRVSHQQVNFSSTIRFVVVFIACLCLFPKGAQSHII